MFRWLLRALDVILRAEYFKDSFSVRIITQRWVFVKNIQGFDLSLNVWYTGVSMKGDQTG
jgi:hypothetical protein